MSNKDLDDFITDPKNIAKAVEGSMDKRSAVLANIPDVEANTELTMPTLSNEELRHKLLTLKASDGSYVISSLIACDPAKLHALIEFIAIQNTALLKELLEKKKMYITELAWKHAASEDAVPIEVINSKLAAMGGQHE